MPEAKNNWARRMAAGGAAICGLALFASPSAAQTSNFYQGKTITMYVGFSAGGGYDAYARAVSQFLGDHIPGRPRVIVENMEGAGSLRLAMYLQDVAPKDGLWIGTFDNGLPYASLLKPDLVKFVGTKINWIGSVTRDQQVCLTSSKSGLQNVDDLRAKGGTFGTTGPDDIRYESFAVLKHLTNSPIKAVPGYPGTADIRHAIDTGELAGECDSLQSLKSTKPEWVTGKEINFVAAMTPSRVSTLPSTPSIFEFAKSDSEKEAVKLIFSSEEAGRPFAAPPGVPQERLDLLRTAFDATMRDPRFLALTKKQGLEVDPITGQQTTGFVKTVYGYPASVVSLARHLIE